MSAATSWAAVEWCMRRFIKTVNDSHCCCYSLLDLTRSHRRVKQTHTVPHHTPSPTPSSCPSCWQGLLNARFCPLSPLGPNLSLLLHSPPSSSLLLFYLCFSLPVSYALSYNYARSLPDAVDLCLSSPAWPPLSPLLPFLPCSLTCLIMCPNVFRPKAAESSLRLFLLSHSRPAREQQEEKKKTRQNHFKC